LNIAVVDYGMGNRRSVEKALEHVGASVKVTHERSELEAADGLVIPGVGAFPKAIENLKRLGLVGLLKERARSGTPLLGICLGMQLLFERSDELESTEGLGLIPGEVSRLRSGGLPVPHIGWSQVSFSTPSPLTERLPEEGCAFYHVHSLVARPQSSAHIIGTAEYGERFATLVARVNVFGAQFHPEKSSAAGLELLRSFVALCSQAHLEAAARA
jgi:imidazole glycerol-phosphate synthase subunit HisH